MKGVRQPISTSITCARRSRVMICIPCMLVGGTEMHTILLARTLIGGGHSVTVCVYYEHDVVMVTALEATGADVVLLRLDRQLDTSNLIATPRLLKTLGAEIQRRRPHFVHVQYMSPGIAPLALARTMGVPHVLATVHVTASHYSHRARIPRHAARQLCDVFLCVSRVAEQSFFGSNSAFSEDLLYSGRRHFTIGNCVDVQAVDRLLAEGPQTQLSALLSTGERPIVGIVGRLDRYKGHNLLLRAFSLVRQSHPEALLLCVGDGSERVSLESLVNELGLRAHVVFTGSLPHEHALRHMALMDVVAMPSRPNLEGFGLSAAEAMAMRKPVVASDVDGLAEVVGREGAGLLVPSEDVPALALAIDRLLSDPQLRQDLGHAARQRVERLFTMEIFANRHLRLYDALRRSHSRRAPSFIPSPLSRVGAEE
jgi:glycosyltransferase involved in cell wall biosynthesis